MKTILTLASVLATVAAATPAHASVSLSSGVERCKAEIAKQSPGHSIVGEGRKFADENYVWVSLRVQAADATKWMTCKINRDTETLSLKAS